MKRYLLVKSTLLVAISCFNVSSAQSITPEQIQMAVTSTKLDVQVINNLAFQPMTTEIRVLLHDAFLLRMSKEDKQEIALALVEAADEDPTFFEFLAGFAEAAVADSSPFPFEMAENGTAIKGKLSQPFVDWCRQRTLDPTQQLIRISRTYIMDLQYLAEARDFRSAPLFRRGLETPNEFVTYISAKGLALLGYPEDIEVIASRCIKALKPGSQMKAWFLADVFLLFETPAADRQFERFITDPGRRLLIRKASLYQLRYYSRRVTGRKHPR